MKIVFASANSNKIGEISALLPVSFELTGLTDNGIYEEIPETGNSIPENSLIKAMYVKQKLQMENLAVFADDSGLEVTALNGAPGVYSARYAGTPKNDEANNAKLLQELKDKADRSARFVTVITLLLNNQKHVFEGEIKGTIASGYKGTNGFGYDPLFVPEGYSKTFAEMTKEEKNQISHRAIAVKKLVKFLENF